jgi:hypothetical protein
MSIGRKSVIALLGVTVVLAAVLVSVAAAGWSSNGPPQTRVYGGGNVPIGSCTDGATTFCTPRVTREFSVFAVHDPNEQITYGTITVGDPERDGGVNSVIRVTCLAVSGNVAEVGGVVVQSVDPSTIGYPYILFFRDSGQPGTVARDGFSPSFTGPPAGKPTCTDASSDAFGLGFFTLTYGDVAIQNVTDQNS